jgi:hypothetical protein
LSTPRHFLTYPKHHKDWNSINKGKTASKGDFISRRLGNARPSITLDVYGHLIPSKQREVAALMDELLTPISIDLTA